MIFIAAIITAIFWHLLLERIWLSSIGSTVTAVVLVLLLVTGAGHPPFYSEGFYSDLANLAGIAFAISVGIGLVFQSVRSKNKNA